MANLVMPKFTITFLSKAASAITRSEKGTVCLLLRDTAHGGENFTITNIVDIPDDLTAETRTQIENALLGYINPPRAVLVYICDGDHNLTAALKWAATQQFDYLCGPADTSSSDAQTIATWVKNERLNNDAIYKAVLPSHAGDSEAIVNFDAADIETEGGTFTAASYCSRIAGLLAGTPMRISATYAPLPEVTDVKRLTPAEQDTAVGTGKFILWTDGSQVMTGRAVNSLQTTTDVKGDQFKKIKLVEIMDMIKQDIRSTVRGEYIGKYANTYANKMLIVAAIRGYLQGLEADDLIAPGWSLDLDVAQQKIWLEANGTDTTDMTEQQLREADTGSYVFLAGVVRPLDAIEDVQIEITI